MNLIPGRIGPCGGEPLAGSARVGDEGEALGLDDGQRLEEQAVDEREDRCIRADAEGEREDCDGREDWRRAKLARGDAKIGHLDLQLGVDCTAPG